MIILREAFKLSFLTSLNGSRCLSLKYLNCEDSFRNKPESSSAIFSGFRKKDSKGNEWLQIRFNWKRGWVRSKDAEIY